MGTMLLLIMCIMELLQCDRTVWLPLSNVLVTLVVMRRLYVRVLLALTGLLSRPLSATMSVSTLCVVVVVSSKRRSGAQGSTMLSLGKLRVMDGVSLGVLGELQLLPLAVW